MTKSNTRQAADVAHIVGRKNLIINGDFKVNQRYDLSSPLTSTGNAYHIDRWTTWHGVANTIEKGSDVINGVTRPTIKLTATATATGHLGINQRVEQQNVPVGVNITISCWLRSNHNKAGLRQNAILPEGDAPTKHSGNGQWEYHTWTQNTATMAARPSVNFGVIIYDDANVSITSGDYIEVADFQVEFGSVATDFEHRSYGEELALCQRYYLKTADGIYMSGQSYAANSVDGLRQVYPFPVTMRAMPTVSVSGGSDGGSVATLQVMHPKIDSVVLNLRSNDGNTSVWWHSGVLTADAEL